MVSARRSVAQMVRVPLSAADWITEVKSSILPVVSGYWGRGRWEEDVVDDMEEVVEDLEKEEDVYVGGDGDDDMSESNRYNKNSFVCVYLDDQIDCVRVHEGE